MGTVDRENAIGARLNVIFPDVIIFTPSGEANTQHIVCAVNLSTASSGNTRRTRSVLTSLKDAVFLLVALLGCIRRRCRRGRRGFDFDDGVSDGFEAEAEVGLREDLAFDDAGVGADRDELHWVAVDLMV